MLWLYLLGAVTFLIIVLRRVLRRQRPLAEQLYTSKVAIEHVHSGAAFVTADGKIGSMNQSLTGSLLAKPGDLIGGEWTLLFPERERAAVGQAYAQMLIQGMATLETTVERTDGTPVAVELRLVTAHDHKMRVRGHHCLVLDLTELRKLETRIKQIETERAQAPFSEAR